LIAVKVIPTSGNCGATLYAPQREDAKDDADLADAGSGGSRGRSLPSHGTVMLKFSKSGEFKLATANETFVTMMYYAMPRRMPTPNGLAGWVA
jgi:hypothetical protein